MGSEGLEEGKYTKPVTFIIFMEQVHRHTIVEQNNMHIFRSIHYSRRSNRNGGYVPCSVGDGKTGGY